MTIGIYILAFSCKNSTESSSGESSSEGLNLTGNDVVAHIDHVCRMDMNKYAILDTLTYKGELYGFCSIGCKEGFLEDPESYLSSE
ncbi:MAG: YHS domain-containing protein [Bacteroidetes bacterium]|nr:YHS domain-containing protein [Bacteroidota bacterium]